MDLVDKYLKLSEAWPGTPEWKKKHDPNYNPYDPEGKARKALKQQPYGYRGKSAEGEEEEKPAEQPAMKKRGRPKKVREDVQVDEAAAEKTYNYAFDKVRDMDAKNPFSKSAKRTMYTKAARNAFQRMKSSGTKPNLPEEVEQVDELKASTLNSYIAKRQGNTANRMAHAMRKLGGKPSKHDVYNTGLKRAQQKIDDKRKKETGMNPPRPRPAAAPAYPLGGRDPASGRSYSESTEIEEGIGGTIAGGIGQFIGNKIDPLHGEILRTHGEMAGRAAEYTIRKHLNRLHKALKSHLSSGNATNEEVELDEISAVTHAKYRTAARADIRKTAKNLDVDSKASDRIEKRVAGLARSTGLERAKKMTGTNEQSEAPFTPDKPKKQAVAGKYGREYSTARHLARMGVQAALKDLKKGPEKGTKQV